MMSTTTAPKQSRLNEKKPEEEQSTASTRSRLKEKKAEKEQSKAAARSCLKEKKAAEEQLTTATRSRLMEKEAEEEQSTAPNRSRLREKKVKKEETEEVFLDAEEDDTNSIDEVGAKMGTDNGDSRSETKKKEKEKRGSGKTKKIATPEKAKEDDGTPARFVGNQVPDAEARKKWPHRYANKVTVFACSGHYLFFIYFFVQKYERKSVREQCLVQICFMDRDSCLIIFLLIIAINISMFIMFIFLMT